MKWLHFTRGVSQSGLEILLPFSSGYVGFKRVGYDWNIFLALAFIKNVTSLDAIMFIRWSAEDGDGLMHTGVGIIEESFCLKWKISLLIRMELLLMLPESILFLSPGQPLFSACTALHVHRNPSYAQNNDTKTKLMQEQKIHIWVVFPRTGICPPFWQFKKKTKKNIASSIGFVTTW